MFLEKDEPQVKLLKKQTTSKIELKRHLWVGQNVGKYKNCKFDDQSIQNNRNFLISLIYGYKVKRSKNIKMVADKFWAPNSCLER